MTVAFDAQSFLDFTATNSWTHTPVGTPKLAVVMIVYDVTSLDRISAVTYGGTTMTRANWAPCDSAEPGVAMLYYLISPPAGAQTVAVTVSAGTEAKVGWAVTATAATTMGLISTAPIFGVGAAATITDPTATLGTPSSFSGIVCNALFSGVAAPSTPASKNSATKLTGTDSGGKDFGTDCACASYNLQSGAAITSGWTVTADDAAMVSAAFAELPTNLLVGIRKNLATNPTAAVDTTGWSNTGLTTFARETSLPTTAGLPGGVTTGFHFVSDGTNDWAEISVPTLNGHTYTVSAYVRLTSNTATGTELNPTSAGNDFFSSNYSTIAGDFQRLSVTFTALANESTPIRICRQNGAGATDGYFTAVLIEEAGSARLYFDGSSSGASWEGTANASVSDSKLGG